MANKSLLATCISTVLRLKGPRSVIEGDSPWHHLALNMGPLRRIKEWRTLGSAELFSWSDTSERRGTLLWVSLLTVT
jgi:hypothetical protein